MCGFSLLQPDLSAGVFQFQILRILIFNITVYFIYQSGSLSHFWITIFIIFFGIRSFSIISLYPTKYVTEYHSYTKSKYHSYQKSKSIYATKVPHRFSIVFKTGLSFHNRYVSSLKTKF